MLGAAQDRTVHALRPHCHVQCLQPDCQGAVRAVSHLPRPDRLGETSATKKEQFRTAFLAATKYCLA